MAILIDSYSESNSTNSLNVGDGSTTFNVPNVKGKVPVGYNSADTSFDALGETGGEKAHTLTTTEIPSHNHGLGSYGDPSTGGTYYYKTTRVSNQFGAGYTENTGGGGSHNNLQPYIVFNYIIKT